MSQTEIQIDVRQSMDQNYIQYSITLPISKMISLDYSKEEQDLLDRVKSNRIMDPLDFVRTLTVIVAKIQGYGIRREWENNHSFGNIEAMYVDHLVMNLEKKSIAEIVLFLAKYCGWDRIKNYVDRTIMRKALGDEDGKK